MFILKGKENEVMLLLCLSGTYDVTQSWFILILIPLQWQTTSIKQPAFLV